MPLPAAGQVWPPEPLKHITPKLTEWDAWYVGDPDRLAGVYQRAGDRQTLNRPGGLYGMLRRMWWGREVPSLQGQDQRPDGLHVPIAADLARVSADLLYSEPPTLTATTTSTATQDRLDSYIEQGLHDVLATGAEVGAALGGRYHRVTWDPTTTDRPFLSTVDHDAALPEFTWGRLTAVTFWQVVKREGRQVWRHLERHETDSLGLGVVFHALYEGSDGELGHPVPLTESSETAVFADRVDAFGALTDPRTPGLCVAYVPNQTPSRLWRADIIGRYLGRSDFDGVEGIMDAVDETYSSLMRDIRIAKGRLVVAESALTSGQPGQGAVFDVDRTVYEAIKVPPSEDNKPFFEAHQFEIRTDEHLSAIEDQVRRVLQLAGYAAATFADGTDGVMTATEVHARERRTYHTRDRKIRHEKPKVSTLAQKMLSIDAAVYRTTGLDWLDPVATEFADTVQDSALSMAQTVQALQVAQSASIETRVRMVHPDWDEPAVEAEVAAIQAEVGQPLADPFSIGRQDPAPTFGG